MAIIAFIFPSDPPDDETQTNIETGPSETDKVISDTTEMMSSSLVQVTWCPVWALTTVCQDTQAQLYPT